jgi:phage tail sheath gpL-like
VISTYQTNGAGAADPSYLDLNTVLTLAYLRQTARVRLLLKYPDKKLADNGKRTAAGSSIVTPNDIKAELVALAGLWEEAGLVENIDQFKRDLVIERNLSDPTRVDCLLPPDLVNQLHIIGLQFQFLL